MNLTKSEMETIIRFDELSARATVYTHSVKLMNALDKLISRYGADSPIERITQGSEPKYATYEVPKEWVKVSPKRRQNYTEEQLKAMAERMKELRKK